MWIFVSLLFRVEKKSELLKCYSLIKEPVIKAATNNKAALNATRPNITFAVILFIFISFCILDMKIIILNSQWMNNGIL